jgi:DNA-directed RNA polymerase subunit M
LNENNAKDAKKGSASKPRGVKFCPKCGSTDIFWASGLPQLWSIWQCRNCGYRGAFIVEDSKLAKKLREDYAKKTAER